MITLCSSIDDLIPSVDSIAQLSMLRRRIGGVTL